MPECGTCFDTVDELYLLHPTAPGKSDHRACHSCINRQLTNELQSKNVPSRACFVSAGCNIDMDHAVLSSVNQESYERLDRLQLRAALRNMPNYVNCGNPEGCGNGWEHEDGADAPILRCRACHYKSCFSCKRQWHEGLSCQQAQQAFEAEVAALAAAGGASGPGAGPVVDRATERVLSVNFKKCPNCSMALEKLAGCDIMRCCTLCAGTDACKCHRKPPTVARFGLGCGAKFCYRCLAFRTDPGSCPHKASCQYA